MQEKSKRRLLPALPGGSALPRGEEGVCSRAGRLRASPSDLGDPYVLFPLTGPQRTVSGMDTGGFCENHPQGHHSSVPTKETRPMPRAQSAWSTLPAWCLARPPTTEWAPEHRRTQPAATGRTKRLRVQQPRDHVHLRKGMRS